MQDNDHKLQQAEGGTEQTSDNIKTPLEESPISEPNLSGEATSKNKEGPKAEDKTPKDVGEKEKNKDSKAEDNTPNEAGEPENKEGPKAEDNTPDEAGESENEEDSKAEDNTSSETGEKEKTEDSEESNDPIDEIDESNAEDAEDTDNEKRHYIPTLDYHSMSMENLVGELQKLVRNEKVQAIGKHVSSIKYEFDQKFQEFLEQKKEEFVSKGGNEIDFKYNSVAKRQFNEVYSD